MLSNTCTTSATQPETPAAHLVPLHGGPWLDDTRPTRSCRRHGHRGDLGWLGCLLLANAPGAAPGVWIALGLAGAIVAFFGAARYGTAQLDAAWSARPVPSASAG